MKLSEIMKTSVATCSPDETLAVAAERMWQRDVGCLPVVDHQGQVRAMVTDRDICMAAYTQGKPIFAIPVSVAMSRQLVACLPSDTVSGAEQMMREHRVRRLPVIDGHGRLLGIVSLNDLARLARSGKSSRKPMVSAEEVAATFAAVSAPRPAVIDGVA